MNNDRSVVLQATGEGEILASGQRTFKSFISPEELKGILANSRRNLDFTFMGNLKSKFVEADDWFPIN
jgi:hypothetical protein